MSSPDVREDDLPVSLATSSTHVPACEPPPTRKLANGLVTRKGTEVSVPCGRSPPRS